MNNAKFKKISKRHPKVFVKCTICGHPFKVHYYRIEITKHFYCNDKCFAKSCSKRFKIQNKGKGNPNYKHGKYCEDLYPNCQICGKKLSRADAKLCQKCFHKSIKGKPRLDFCLENHPNYKGGRKDKCICGRDKQKTSEFCNSCAKKGKLNPSWLDGISRFPYSLEFSPRLKKQIRERDNFICQKCGMTEKEHLKKYGKALSIHHIDYDKQNCKESNLLTLCCRCNKKVNFNRKYWTEYFLKQRLYKINGELNTKIIKENYYVVKSY